MCAENQVILYWPGLSKCAQFIAKMMRCNAICHLMTFLIMLYIANFMTKLCRI